jgi:thiol-disulfide isomerase/thioredoxin
MNKIILYSLIFVLAFSCKQDKIKTSELIINSNHADIDLIEISRPINGMILWDNQKDSIKINKKGFYNYSFNITAPEIIRLKIGEERLKMIIQPNHSYKIEAIDSSITFKLDNAKGNKLLNNLNRGFNGTDIEAYKYENDSTAALITQKVNALKNNEIRQLDLLYLKKEINEGFYKIFKNEIDYYYAEKITGLIIGKSYRLIPLKQDLELLLKETIEKYPVSAEIIPSNWFEYADLSIIEKNIYEQKKSGLITQDSLEKMFTNGSIQFYKKAIIKKHLDGTYREKLFAYYIILSAKQKNYEKSIIDLFENFRLLYPNSKYTQYLEPEINEIKDYHQKIQSDLPNTIKIIESENINSLPELLTQFKGQKIYIDLWATWCAPCKKEFKYNKDIDIILEKNNIKKLYISIDENERKDKWIEMIKFHELNGLHFLSNKNFKADFADKFTIHNGVFSIPQYLVIDEEGNIITNNAPMPSQSDELSKLLITL